MNAVQIQHVQDSFRLVAPMADEAAALFYSRLFELNPELRSLFKSDPKEQGRKLMTMIGMAVRGLGNLAALAPVVQNLGRRHAGYGVKAEHYAVVGAALLWTLEQGLGSAFSGEVKAAWTEAYMHLAGIMQQAAAVPA